MKKLNFDFPLKYIDGTELKDEEGVVTAGRTLANALALSKDPTIKDPAKIIAWAIKLISGEEIEVSPEEERFLSGFIAGCDWSAFVKADVLKAFE